MKRCEHGIPDRRNPGTGACIHALVWKAEPQHEWLTGDMCASIGGKKPEHREKDPHATEKETWTPVSR